MMPPVQEASASPKPEKRPVISHAREEEPEPEPQLESAAFYNRLFNDFPEQPQQPVPPTEEEMAQQQHKKDVIESVKGAVSEAEQPGNPPHKKTLDETGIYAAKGTTVFQNHRCKSAERCCCRGGSCFYY